MTTTHPNWIAERAKCNRARLWSDMTYIVAEDLRRKNQEEKKLDSSLEYSFFPTPTDPYVLVIRCHDASQGNQGGYSFPYDPKTQEIVGTREFPNETVRQEAFLTTRWDAEACQCRVVVKIADAPAVEFPHDQLWKAVQVILELFFFPAE